MFKNAGIPVLGVIENMSYMLCDHCGEKTFPFGQSGGQHLATLLEVPFLGEIPMNPSVRQNADAGVPMVIAEPDSLQAEAFRDIAHLITTSICELGVNERLRELTPA